MKLLLCRGKSLQRIPRIGQGECPRIPGELVINGRVAIRIHKEDSFLIREILLDYDIADVKAVHLLSEALQAEASTPFVLLTEHADEKTVAEIIAAGAWDCMEKSELNGANLVRTIGCALALHSMQQGRQFAEDSLRNMSRAVEQSADAIMITHRQGIIEYVNPDLNSKGILPPGSHRTDAANS